MQLNELKPWAKKSSYQGLDAWIPKLTIKSPYGDITHTMRVMLTSRKDAMDAARQWREESIEAGYIC